jgi:membrane protease YdiL (CAAX protease family)
MTTPRVPDGRFRAYLQFVVGLFYYFLARALARHGAAGLSNEQWSPIVEQAMLVFLLLLGYAGLGFSLNRQMHPVTAQGLPRRPGWSREVGMGVAFGWAVVVLCAAVLAVGGGIAIRFSGNLQAWGWFLVDVAFFALAALAEEIAFRGYAFQRFSRAVGSAGAVLGFAALYAFLQSLQPGSNRVSTAVALVFTVLLSVAYLRTRALWISWGINFGWKAARALLFGLAVTGVNSHSPVVQGDPMGPFWLTGGGFGLDGSWLAFFVLVAAIPVVYRLTRDLDFAYNAPEIVPGGIPVDLDGAARRQHDAAMGAAATVEPATPSLVQIAPAGPAAPPRPDLPSVLPQPVPHDLPQPIAGNDSE